MWGTISPNWAKRNAGYGALSTEIEVTPISLLEVIKAHGVPYYMKIDIEGCDQVCLNTLKKLSVRPDYVSFESDKVSFGNIYKEIELLAELGYIDFKAIEQSTIHTSQTSPYPPTEGKYVDRPLEFNSSGLFGSELNGRWRSKRGILNLYRFIWCGYYLLGDEGIMNKWKFYGAAKLRSIISQFLKFFTKAAVPGWYDTHARHSSVLAK